MGRPCLLSWLLLQFIQNHICSCCSLKTHGTVLINRTENLTINCTNKKTRRAEKKIIGLLFMQFTFLLLNIFSTESEDMEDQFCQEQNKKISDTFTCQIFFEKICKSTNHKKSKKLWEVRQWNLFETVSVLDQNTEDLRKVYRQYNSIHPPPPHSAL